MDDRGEKNFGRQVGRLVRSVRDLRQLNQDEVAERMGFANQSPLSKIEQGKKRVLLVEIWKLADELDLPFVSLAEGIQEFVAGRGDDWVERLERGEVAGREDGARRLAEEIVREAERQGASLDDEALERVNHQLLGFKAFLLTLLLASR